MQYNWFTTVESNTVVYTSVENSTVKYTTVVFTTVEYNTVENTTVEYNAVEYNTAEYTTVVYSKVEYNTACSLHAVQYIVTCRSISVAVGWGQGTIYISKAVFGVAGIYPFWTTLHPQCDTPHFHPIHPSLSIFHYVARADLSLFHKKGN